MMIGERREKKQSVLVVLEGIKASKEKTGIAPLCKAMREVSHEEDEILVLTILPAKEESGAGPFSDVANSECFSDHHLQCNQSRHENSYINFYRQEITQKKEVYGQIFRPFYDTCKANKVKFQVKIAACFRLQDIIIEEVNNANATLIVMDSYFTRDLSFRLTGTECNVSLVGGDDDDEALVPDHLLLCDGSECSMVVEERLNPKSPKLMNGSTQQEQCIKFSSEVVKLFSPSLASTSREKGKQTIPEPLDQNRNIESLEPQKGEISPHDDSQPKVGEANVMLGVPLQLSWEVITEITSGFSTKFCSRQKKNYMTYTGYLTQVQKHVLVKRFTESCSCIFQAEKKAALSIHHRNIIQLLAYHQSDTSTVLVYPLPLKGTLDDILSGLGEYKLKLNFQQKLKIAIGIAQGIRYMHEECPGGPVAHGQLQLSNILLRYDLEPLISGFGNATWIHLEQPPSISDKRSTLEDPLNHESMELLKSDVYSFGVLLLRLFCQRELPEEDRSLIELARPLMLDRKFHELLEDEWEISDLHGFYRVMAAATQCTKTKPTARPFMSEVISILKGDNFSDIEPSPSNSSS